MLTLNRKITHGFEMFVITYTAGNNVVERQFWSEIGARGYIAENFKHINLNTLRWNK